MSNTIRIKKRAASVSAGAPSSLSPSELAYDVLLKNSNNEREYYIQGTIFVSEGYTTFE